MHSPGLIATLQFPYGLRLEYFCRMSSIYLSNGSVLLDFTSIVDLMSWNSIDSSVGLLLI